ncbi:hypothetical protein CLV91_0778 [Maribacter vaceletii]|uniref:Succinylglutamate desuccinylase/Aspartoacylase catalytic domain-containing protein n=1 Tax=Maribacter vaceletii TaxID=1206816 RepID=A0A495ECT6_9FLAO|nr:succinylglutamate desuccinylase/aspartoacylase family protein [Maribacter vaceletii]RKR14700.1 hypothetical protein CLV91_0778 [Maribacter vaceletii]
MEGLKNKTIVIGGETVSPGKNKLVSISIGRLPTGTLIDIPVHVFNAKEPGPILLVQAGLHGDEINGVEIVRRMLYEKKFAIKKGAVIAVPILNIFGFIHYSRDVPDGKDVNRSFPGSKTGSLAGRMAYRYVSEILPQIDFGIDLHTGGAQRSNYPQIRYTVGDELSKDLATAFNAPFTFSSKLIKGSFRNISHKMGKPTVVFEGGESMRFDTHSISEGIQGVLNVLQHFSMIEKGAIGLNKKASILLTDRRWLRAPTAGMFIPEEINGASIKKNAVLGIITDTFTLKIKTIKAPYDGFICAINNQAVVNQGDALFHVGKREF